MTTTFLEQALKLPVAERLELAEALWDSISPESEYPPLTSEQKRELDRRLDDLKQNPTDEVDWEAAKRIILGSR